MIKFYHKYMDELEAILEKYQINRQDICLVGSMALSFKGIREHGDVDLCAAGEPRELLEKETKGNYLSENVNLVVDKYERLLGITDLELINNDKYHEIIDGYKVIRLEIEFSAKLLRNWAKDKDDLPLIEQYIVSTEDWDWELVIAEKGKLKRKQQSRWRRITKYLIKALKNPGLVKNKLFKAYKKKYMVDKKRIAPVPALQDQLVVKIPTAALLGNQFAGEEFARYDLLLRYLMVKGIAEDQDDFIKEYNLMQNKRVGRDTEINIKNLVNSIQKRGFLSRHPIPITRDGLLIEGAHRLACALYFQVQEVPVEIRSWSKDIYYGRDWFVENGFEEKLITRLDETKDYLFKEYGVWFSVILWPPVEPWFDQIEAWLVNNYKVVSKDDIYLGDDFPDFTKEIYAIDDIDRWKVERKIYVMQNYSPKIRTFAIEIADPQFREKKRTSGYLSDLGAKLKEQIRNEYKKKVPGYIYDIVCHTGDNHEHNREIFKIIDKFKYKHDKISSV